MTDIKKMQTVEMENKIIERSIIFTFILTTVSSLSSYIYIINKILKLLLH